MMVNLSKLPDPNRVYSAKFERLDGGLNLRELDYRLDNNESPEMKNLWWQDGVLQCRNGQAFLCDDESLGTGFCSFGRAFWGHAFLHIGKGIYAADFEATPFTLRKICDGVPENRGTFFRWSDWLFYKNKGGFFRIAYKPERDEPFFVEKVEDFAYVPNILLNSTPSVRGSGDLYQPENRLSAKKSVKYNAVANEKKYLLPVESVDSVDLVFVDGKKMEPTTDYTVDLTNGSVEFVKAPTVQNPPVNNTVEIVYSKTNEDAFNSIMGCNYATVAGNNTDLCILLAGCDAQPNAVFWNSNDHLSMNAAYWPMSYYNLVGDTEDAVTGFGKQYSDLMVLKKQSIGRLTFDTENIDGRESISFVYADVNSKVGCDLPWSIQLVENNLVFCNTYTGAHIVRSSSAAYENNIECISRNVNGNETQGLLRDVRQGAVTASYDDDSRYWICANGSVYLWDYGLSTFTKPSWFYFDAVQGVSFFRDDEGKEYHLDSKGRVTGFQRSFTDYDRAIEKVYRFPTMDFGSYDRLKDVDSLLVSVRSDTETDVAIRYDTDYGSFYDLSPIQSYSWRLFPRNLARRYLAVSRYAHVARRKPGCRHIRHFSMTFSNNEVGCDLALVSAQIFYKFQGRER